MRKIYLPVFFLTFCLAANSQTTTFDRVYSILQTNCTGTCHNTANHAGNLDFTAAEPNVYTALVNVTPQNSAAATMGNKLADPGNPRNSFLFKKIARGLDANLSLTAAENPTTHDTLAVMTQTEREMIRQWILFGAKDTGNFVNEQTITNFYVGQGGQPRQPVLPVPPAGQGQQFYWGPLFMTVGQEFEYSNKFHVNNTIPWDVTRMNVTENDESHHYALYKFQPNRQQIFEEGMQRILSIANEAAIFYNADVIGQWPNNFDITYPTGTGYYWDTATTLDISYHLINYNDSIIAAEAYLNVYYAPHQGSTIPIQTAQIRYGGDEVWRLVIPNNGQDTTFTIDQHDPDSTFLWNIISLQAHTHKLGRDFNVWTRNANDTKDSLIYKGSYSPDYSYDQGVYIWNNPPYRQFTPPLQVDMTKGLIHEATYNNTGPDTVGFGLTTSDEMYVTFIVYYKSDYGTGVHDLSQKDDNLQFYPNPAQNTAYIRLNSDVDLQNAQLKLYAMLGNEVVTMNHITDYNFKVDVSSLADGCYIYKLFNKGLSAGTGKVVLQHNK